MREEDDCGIEAVSSTRKGGSRRWHARLGRWTGSCLPPSCLNKEEDKEIFASPHAFRVFLEILKQHHFVCKIW
jgi:hypothetical protein